MYGIKENLTLQEQLVPAMLIPVNNNIRVALQNFVRLIFTFFGEVYLRDAICKNIVIGIILDFSVQFDH